MVFSSTIFLFLFLPLLIVLYYIPHSSRSWKNTVLLVFSIFFYAWGEPVFVFIMLFSIVLNWFLVLLMEKYGNHRKFWLTVALVYDILLLGVYKYASFLSQNLVLLTGRNDLLVTIALPIGISFFTFQMMSYVLDVYYGNAAAQKNPFYVALYISLFPQLIAGPIVRYRDIEIDIISREESFSEVSLGIIRFVYGLAKKVLLANFLAQIADNVFDYAVNPSLLYAWLGAVAYTLQIYFDFSGYSDMAIGLGQMFGFHFLENFNYPYIAGTVTEFWRRWHISLSSWFRDYVYIPLGGNRVKKPRWIFNLFIVWLLTGIWHGANWTFVLWGLFYFVVLLIEKLSGLDKRNTVLSHGITIIVVILAWVIFRSPDLASAVKYIGTMFGYRAAGFIGADVLGTVKRTYIILIAGAIGATPVVKSIFEWLRSKGFAWIEFCWLMLIMLLSILEVVSSTYNPFIYFNF